MVLLQKGHSMNKMNKQLFALVIAGIIFTNLSASQKPSAYQGSTSVSEYLQWRKQRGYPGQKAAAVTQATPVKEEGQQGEVAAANVEKGPVAGYIETRYGKGEAEKAMERKRTKPVIVKNK